MILLLMLFCHVIDDFVLQTQSLNVLKCKGNWDLNNYVNKSLDGLYDHDYLMALFVHSLSWAIAIHLPIMFLMDIRTPILFISVAINLVIHFIVDDLKANKRKLNLVHDQLIHFAQVFLTFIILNNHLYPW